MSAISLPVSRRVLPDTAVPEVCPESCILSLTISAARGVLLPPSDSSSWLCTLPSCKLLVSEAAGSLLPTRTDGLGDAGGNFSMSCSTAATLRLHTKYAHTAPPTSSAVPTTAPLTIRPTWYPARPCSWSPFLSRGVKGGRLNGSFCGGFVVLFSSEGLAGEGVEGRRVGGGREAKAAPSTYMAPAGVMELPDTSGGMVAGTCDVKVTPMPSMPNQLNSGK
mmetsp:Transcript_38595/g.85901  ORF Transcript_38595/g.85901 Transcript_38595/m.85901 type:complete len:221 (+) Transcript_38595:2712-3374(+)